MGAEAGFQAKGGSGKSGAACQGVSKGGGRVSVSTMLVDGSVNIKLCAEVDRLVGDADSVKELDTGVWLAPTSVALEAVEQREAAADNVVDGAVLTGSGAMLSQMRTA